MPLEFTFSNFIYFKALLTIFSAFGEAESLMLERKELVEEIDTLNRLRDSSDDIDTLNRDSSGDSLAFFYLKCPG